MFARIWKGKKINHAIQVEFSANDNNFKSKQAFNITTSCNTLKPPKKFNFEYENEANSFDDHEMEKNCNPLSDKHYGNVVTLRIL